MTTPDPTEPAAPPHTILVVDDEVLVRMAIAEYLRECGFHVFEAADGQEAIEVLQASERTVDLVFCDVQMPRMDGFSVARWVRANLPGVRIVLTTGNIGLIAQKASEVCLDGPVVEKPYDHAQLVQRIRAMLLRAKNG